MKRSSPFNRALFALVHLFSIAQAAYACVCRPLSKIAHCRPAACTEFLIVCTVTGVEKIRALGRRRLVEGGVDGFWTVRSVSGPRDFFRGEKVSKSDSFAPQRSPRRARVRFGRRVSSPLPPTFMRNAFAHQIPRRRPQYPPPPPNSSTNTTIIRINSMGSLH